MPSIPELTVPPWADAPPITPPVSGPPVQRTVVDACACGHAKDAHEHYRPGHDCGVCGADVCDDYRKLGGSVRRTFRRWGLVG